MLARAWSALNGLKTVAGVVITGVGIVSQAVLKPECAPNPLSASCIDLLPHDWQPILVGAGAAVTVLGALHKAAKRSGQP